LEEWTLQLMFQATEGLVGMNKAPRRSKCGTEGRWEKNSPPTCILSEGRRAGLQNATGRVVMGVNKPSVARNTSRRAGVGRRGL